MLTPSRLRHRWQNARYRQLVGELLAGRLEADLALDERVTGSLPAAALALLRLGELRQGEAPFARPFLEHLLLTQDRHGGWGQRPAKAICTALCIRGLEAVVRSQVARQHGIAGARLHDCAGRQELGMSLSALDQPGQAAARIAIEHGISYLAWTQAPGGEWADGFSTAVVLLQLGRMHSFCAAVRVAAALEWRRQPAQTPQERLAWSHVSLRSGRGLRTAVMQHAGRPRRVAPLFANVA